MLTYKRNVKASAKSDVIEYNNGNFKLTTELCNKPPKSKNNSEFVLVFKLILIIMITEILRGIIIII